MNTETNNLYQAPGADINPTQPLNVFPYATKGQRFVNLIVDTIGFYAMVIVIGIVAVLLEVDYIFDDINDYVFGLMMLMLYYLPQEAIWGRTLGKLISGTKVVNYQNEVPSFGQLIGRTLCRIIPFESFSYLFTDPCHGWHDSIPKTRVVNLRADKRTIEGSVNQSTMADSSMKESSNKESSEVEVSERKESAGNEPVDNQSASSANDAANHQSVIERR